MATSKFRNLSQHVSYSEKIKSDIDETGKDVLQKIEDIDQETCNNLLSIILNNTIKSIFDIACDLQDIVIKSNKEDLSNSNLKTVVKKLSQDCNQLVQEYENDHSALKEKFQIFIQNVLCEAEGLFNIIKKDDLHAHKHELVEVLEEFLCTLHRMQMRIRFQNLSINQLVQLIEDVKRQYMDDIGAIESNPESLKQFVIHLRHVEKHGFDVGVHLIKMASNYDGEIQHEILNAANLFINTVAEWLLFSNNVEIGNAEAHFKNCYHKFWLSLESLLHYMENQLENKTASKNLKDLIAFVISYAMVNSNQVGRIIKYN